MAVAPSQQVNDSLDSMMSFNLMAPTLANQKAQLQGDRMK
jgi:hypothetical protein